MRDTWTRAWPVLLAVITVTAVGVPAAVASYRHARTLVERSGDTVMAPWLPLSVDGMLLAALVVIWVRRHRRESAGLFPWLSFGAGMVATIAANLAAAFPTLEGYAVALWPPVALAITLELVALVASRTSPGRSVAGGPETVAQLWATIERDRATAVLDQSGNRVVTAGPGLVELASPAVVTAVPDQSLDQSATDGPGLSETAGLALVPAVPDRDETPVLPGPETVETDGPGTDETDADLHGHDVPAVPGTDDEVRDWLRDQHDQTGQVPSRRDTLARFRIGATRADRLRDDVTAETAGRDRLRRVK